MAKILLTHAEQIFDVLGGVKSVALLTGGTYNRAHNWKAYNRFPTSTYILIKSALALKGYDANDNLWPEMLGPTADTATDKN